MTPIYHRTKKINPIVQSFGHDSRMNLLLTTSYSYLNDCRGNNNNNNNNNNYNEYIYIAQNK